VTTRPAEATRPTTRIMRFTLGVPESRAYWHRARPGRPAAGDQRALRDQAAVAFAEQWFGRRSEQRVHLILANLRARYDRYPAALDVLHRWQAPSPDTRRLICHWHLQLVDPVYRSFSGDLLRASVRGEGVPSTVDRDYVAAWVEGCAPGRWAIASRLKIASKLLTAAREAGLASGRLGVVPVPRPLVEDDALGYLLYLLRGVRIADSLVDNPYLASVGLVGADLSARLRSLPAVSLHRLADVAEFEWGQPDLTAWAEATLSP